MSRRLIIAILTVLVATVWAPAPASAEGGNDKPKFLSLPPDLTTGYLQGHYAHRDPLHPDVRYAHRKLSTATDRGVDRLDGDAFTIPAGELCDFPVKITQWGTRGWWDWVDENGDGVHHVENPKLLDRLSANGKSLWSLDEGWDYIWPNPDGSTFIEGTGTHVWIHDKHHKFRQYGTWHLAIGPTGALEYDRYIRDSTSIWDGTIAQGDRKVCRWLSSRG